MCGIVGYINNTKINNEKIIKDMAEKIKHRGPDGEGYYISDKVTLGHKRLKIVDRENGKQPISNEDGSIWIVYNGEIYNYQELAKELKEKGHKFKTNTDTEVIIHGYEEWKEDVTSHLRGMYAFAIWDKIKEELYLIRDPFGIKPLYYYKNKKDFMFASEIKALIAHPSFKKELNKEVLSSYLCFGYIATHESIFKNVYNLEPGEILKYKNGKISIKKYFKLDLKEDEKEANIKEEIEKNIKESIKLHTNSDLEIGVLLSSGLDSSLITSLGGVRKTYTVGYKNKKYSEVKNAEELTKILNIENKSKKVTKEEYMKIIKKIMYYMDEPIADPSVISLYYGVELASKDVKILLSGEGADELFGGYLSYREEIDYSWYMKLPYIIRRTASLISSIFKDRKGLNFIYRRGIKLENYNIGNNRIFKDKEAIKLLKDKNQKQTKEITKEIYETCKYKNNLIKRQTIDIYYTLNRDYLRSVDRITSIFKIESRTPFLDKKIYESASKLRTEEKINKETTKVILREIGKKYIPCEAYKRKKLGFPVPLREWIQSEEIYTKIKKKFEEEKVEEIFKRNKILKLLEEHKKGKRDNYKKIWSIYVFLIWYDIYF